MALNENLTAGSIEIGMLTSSFLFGILTIQVYHFFSNFSDDPRHLKAFVILIWLFDFVFLCLASYFVLLISTTRTFTIVVSCPKSLSAAAMIYGLINGSVQSFFAYQIWRLASGLGRLIPATCWVLAFARFTVVNWIAVATIRAPLLSDIVVNIRNPLISALISGATVDAVIALSLCSHFWRFRGHGFKRTQKLVDKVMAMYIQTGSITSILSFATMIAFLVMEDNLVWLAICFCLMQSYSISLLASLNLRATVQTALRGSVGLPTGLHYRSHSSSVDPRPSSSIAVPTLRPYKRSVTTPLS